MKRLAIVLTLFATPAFAGVTYQFDSTSTGMQSGTTSGTVSVEGTNIRVDLKTGDNFMFKDGTTVLSTDGGKTLNIYDSSAKTYFVVNLSDLTNMGGLLNDGGGMFKLSFNNPKVNVTDLGDGGSVAGYPTKRSKLDASYDIAVNAMGTTMTTHMTMSTESWTTDKLSGEYANFLQEKNLRTGNAELDKLITAQSGAIAGRFPLKQVTTVKVSQGGNDMSSTTTSIVSNVEMKTVPSSAFTAPTGYTKIDDPMSKMLKGIKR